MSVLIDTCVFVAVYNSRDVNHAKAKKMMEECTEGNFGKPFISDYIFDETITTTLVRSKNLKKSITLGEFILNSEIEMIRIDEQCFQMAWEIFKKHKLSFSDCTSLSIMNLYGIDQLMTFDKKLKKASNNRVIG